MNGVAGIREAINQILADHPMWIGDDNQPLDYSAEREARIAEFIWEVERAVEPVLAEVWEEGRLEYHRAKLGCGKGNPYRKSPRVSS